MSAPSKYRNVKTVVDNIPFDSKKEAARYSELVMLKRIGYITDLQLQYRMPLVVNNVKICTYIADFYYKDRDGREIVEDVKGMKTALYRIKCKLVQACYGLRVLET